MSDDRAVLVLENGTELHGTAYGARGSRLGEVVFATGMSGHQETLTDPSYVGQIVVQTSPHVGITGVNAQDMESARVWVQGYAVRDASRVVSNYRAEGTLEDLLITHDVVGISDIDTRMLTRMLREQGTMRGGIFSGTAADQSQEQMLAHVRSAPSMTGSNFVEQVSIAKPLALEPSGQALATVAMIDLGVKSSITRLLVSQGLRVLVLPASTTFAQIQQIDPDAVFYSNGPGDPATADHQIAVLRDVLRARIPFFGICFGHQLFARALGFDTYKLDYGHRGANHPVLDHATGAVLITAHNHGFAVRIPVHGEHLAPADPEAFGRVMVSHSSLNDQVVEGIRCLDLPAFSVQFHPEAASGPHDAMPAFDAFMALIAQHKQATLGEDH